MWKGWGKLWIKPSEPSSMTPSQAHLDEVLLQCNALSRDVEHLGRRIDDLAAEWEEWKDKVYHWMKRIQMRERPAASTNSPSLSGTGPENGETKTDDPVLARILARRAARVRPGSGTPTG